MVKRPPSRFGGAQRAWLITFPLGLLALICGVAFWIAEPPTPKDWLLALPFFVAYLIINRDVFNIVIWRSTFAVTVSDVPLVLAFFYLPPVLVILVVSGAILVHQSRSKVSPVK